MALYNSIVSGIGKYGRAAEVAVNRGVSIFNGDENSAANIRDTYLNGFLSNESKFEPRVFSRLFDEPTYLTFRIEFDFSTTNIVNEVKNENGTYLKNYDYMPEPFLSLLEQNKDYSYSAYSYLKNNKNEQKRAAMLKTFILSLRDVQTNYPYYFQSIDGLGDLMKIDPKKGIRIPTTENNVLTIKCLEGLDMKITQLMQLYRKIVWDDYYQRWILPDMMRYFTMKIYVSEIRLFHTASTTESLHKKTRLFTIAEELNTTSYSYGSKILDTTNHILNDVVAVSSELLGTRSTATQVAQGIGQVYDTLRGLGTSLSSDYYKLCNNAINDVMPTICFECHQCEFVIDDTLSQLSSLSASTKDNKAVEPTIKIKVGKVLDTQVYPLNADLKVVKDQYYLPSSGNYAEGSYFVDDYLRNPNDNSHTGTEDMSSSERFITHTFKRINENVYDQNGELSYRPHHTDRQDAAMSLTRSVLNFFTQDEARSAATTIDSIKEYIYYGDVIRSVATSEENRQKIADGVFVQTLDEIVKSKATDGETALTALSEHILDSLATNGELKIKK